MDKNGHALTLVPPPADMTLDGYTHNLQQKIQMAAIMLKSGMLPARYKSAEAVLTAVLYGAELGLSPLQSINSVTVIQGVPTLDASGIKALVLRNGGRVKTIRWHDTVCELEMTRADQAERHAYTLDDAKRAGLAGKDNWQKNPKAMLYARCVSILGRNMYADALKGMYSTEEMKDALPQAKTAPRQDVVDVTPETSVVESLDEMTLENATYVAHIEPRPTNIRALKFAMKDAGWKLDPDSGFFYGNTEVPELTPYLTRSDYAQEGHAEVEADPASEEA